MKSFIISTSTVCLLFLTGCSELKDNAPSTAVPVSSLHEKGWNDTASSGFHGRTLKTAGYDTKDCQPCHGKVLNGGTSDVSCRKCHTSYPHSAGWVDAASGSFHGRFIAGEWKMDQCKACHGRDYAGGSSGKRCAAAGCHQSRTGAAKSPEVCNTCHGDFRADTADIASWAPPRTIAGDTLTSVRGVGAHRKHLAGTLGRTVRCQECHVVPATLYAQGHLDSSAPAEVYMRDTIANVITAHGTKVPHPLYTPASGTCASTYCHGNWIRRKIDAPDGQSIFTDSVMTGAAFTPTWTNGSADAACGTTCHTNPPKGHAVFTISTCSVCHGDVVDGTGKIIDKTKHINGKINVGSSERSF